MVEVENKLEISHVTDLVHAIIKLQEANRKQNFNVGSGKETINKIANLIGGKSFYSKRPGEFDRSCADISKTFADRMEPTVI